MIEKKVFETMAKILNIEPQMINYSSSSDNTDNWDSLKQLEIMTALEEEFNLEFEEEEIMNTTNTKDLVALVKARLA